MQALTFTEICAITDASPIRERDAVRKYLEAVSFGRAYPRSVDLALEDAATALADYAKLTARPQERFA